MERAENEVDFNSPTYIVEDFSPLQLSELLLWKHAGTQLNFDEDIQIKPFLLDIAKGAFTLLSPNMTSVIVKVWFLENKLMFYCDCNERKSRLCNHQALVLYRIIKDEEIRVFYDDFLRAEKLKRVAKDYGVEHEQDMVGFFNLVYHNEKLTIAPKLSYLLNVTQHNIERLKADLLVDKHQAFKRVELDLDLKRIVIIQHHKYYKHLLLNMCEVSIGLNGRLKNPVVPIELLPLSWKEKNADRLKFVVSLMRFQQAIASERVEEDLEALRIIVSNPLNLDFYYQADINKQLTIKDLIKIRLNVLRADNVKIVVLQKEQFYEIDFYLEIAGKSYNVDEVFFPFNYFILLADVFYFISDIQVFKIIQVFRRTKGKLTVHQSKYNFIKEEILDKINDRLSIDYVYASQVHEGTVDLSVRIWPEKIIYLSEFGDYVVIDPVIRYGEVEIPIRTRQQVFGADNKGKPFLIKRDESLESEFMSQIIRQHAYFEEQLTDDLLYFYLHKNRFFDSEWFLETFEQWQNEQITVLGYNKLSGSKRNPHKAAISIEVTSGLNWFNTEIDVKFGNKKVRLKELNKAVKNKAHYVLLDDGAYGVLPAEWLEKFEQLFNSGTLVGEQLHTPKTNYQDILAFYDDKMLSREVHEELSVYKHWETNETKSVALPEALEGTLRGYQKEGYFWLHSLAKLGFGGCLADDMGLGKSVQVIAFILSQQEMSEQRGMTLVVVPNSLLFNWVQEIQKFAPSLRSTILHGAGRSSSEDDLRQFDVVLTSYGTMVSDIYFLRKIAFKHIFLDESQNIKNPSSQRHRAACLLKADMRVAITGTPIENNTIDLFSQLSFACPGLLGSKQYFKDVYSTPIDKFGVNKRLQELQKKIRPFILRRTKKEVGNDLPEKTEMVVYCEMDEEQREIYNLYEREFREYISAQTNEEITNKSAMVLKGLTRLRQICNSPVLLKDKRWDASKSAKMEWLMEEVEGRVGQHKVLIFSQYVQMLELIEEQLNTRKLNYAKLTGSTKDRESEVEKFKQGSHIRIFLISLKAGGVGLNLTEADYVYVIDPWWNPAVENQAIDRCYRIGQKKNVIAVRLICKGTIEEKVVQLKQTKNELIDKIIESAVMSKNVFSKEYLLNLLNNK